MDNNTISNIARGVIPTRTYNNVKYYYDYNIVRRYELGKYYGMGI